jgi:hypothetical protein
MKLWKQLVGLFFLLVIFDGALRKWVLPSQELILFVVKDVVLWGGYLAYATRRNAFELPRPLRTTWVPTLLGAYVAIVLLQAVNIRQPALTVSALGLKSHLAYAPLVVLLPPLVARATSRQMEHLLWGYALCIQLPIVALSIFQFFQPPSAWINNYVADSATVAAVEGYPRITGTFSYIGSFTPYLQFAAFLSASVLLAGLRWNRGPLKRLGWILLAGTAIILPMTGSRSVVFISIGGLIALFFVVKNRGYLLRIVGAVLGVVGILLFSFGEIPFFKGWELVAERTESAGTERVVARSSNRFTAPIVGITEAGLFGYGVGTNHQAAGQVTSASDWPGRYGGDRPGLRVIMELGILGWLVLVALKLALVFVALQALRRSQAPIELIIGATAFCVLLSSLVTPVVYNAVGSALHWGSAGAVLGVWSLQQVRQTTAFAGAQGRK